MLLLPGFCKCWFFRMEENRRSQRKKLDAQQSKEKKQQQTQLRDDAQPMYGIRPESSCIGEGRALSPLRLHHSSSSALINFHRISFQIDFEQHQSNSNTIPLSFLLLRRTISEAPNTLALGNQSSIRSFNCLYPEL